ncbi:MAG: DUF2786 domain-containing protein [Actinobacteria bacterium]|nr:DUF2786 domain-containing protein [Actinomycetota bacterium]
MPTIETVAALLAKSERTDNADEADAYLAKAQQLATLHAIDLASLAARQDRRRTPAVLTQRTIRVGEPRRAANTHLVELFSAIARPNDVLIDVAHNSTYVIAYGTTDDIDTSEAIWLACAPRMVQGAHAWMKSRKWSGETTRKYRPGVGIVDVPITGRTAKATYMLAFTSRIGARLREARQAAVTEHDTAPGAGAAAGSGDAELVLVQKSAQVRSFHAAKSKARGTWRGYGGSAAGAGSGSARAGDAAARVTRLGGSPELGKAGELPAG